MNSRHKHQPKLSLRHGFNPLRSFGTRLSSTNSCPFSRASWNKPSHEVFWVRGNIEFKEDMKHLQRNLDVKDATGLVR
jgi:hypothetical protein